MPPRTALVVGNGLVLDLINNDPRLATEWHPGRPLSWEVRTHDGRLLRECLPRFFREVDDVSATDGAASDFAVIDEIVKRAEERGREQSTIGPSQTGIAAALLQTETLHFLALSYSALDLELKGRALDDWRWVRYIQDQRDHLVAVISFNYDTVIERVLTRGGLPFFHCGVERQAGLPLGKPHGSVDYAMAGAIRVERGIDYPISNALLLNDAPMERLIPGNLTSPRLTVEVVPPLSASRIRGFQWVWPIFDAFRQLGPAIERCVFLGISCWPVDQPEICDILRALNPGTEVVVANPDLRALLILDFHARRLGLGPATWWRSGPDS